MSLTVEKCIEGWTNSLRQLKVKTDIVFFGDSLTYYGDYASVFPDKVVCNLGLRGDTLEGMIYRVEQIKLVNPEVVYVLAGINDVAYCCENEFKERYCALLDAIMYSHPEVRVVVQSILPVNDSEFSVNCNNKQIAKCNHQIEVLAFKYGIQYLDTYSAYQEAGELPIEMTIDGLHLKPESYCIWYEMLKNSQ